MTEWALDVRVLSLACCAVEAGDALDDLAGPACDGQGGGDEAPLRVLVVAGTVTRSSAARVREAYAELPEPRAVVAFGACTISGGPYWDSYAVEPGIAHLVPVDVFVPGCPPRPADLVAALRTLRTGERA